MFNPLIEPLLPTFTKIWNFSSNPRKNSSFHFHHISFISKIFEHKCLLYKFKSSSTHVAAIYAPASSAHVVMPISPPCINYAPNSAMSNNIITTVISTSISDIPLEYLVYNSLLSPLLYFNLDIRLKTKKETQTKINRSLWYLIRPQDSPSSVPSPPSSSSQSHHSAPAAAAPLHTADAPSPSPPRRISHLNSLAGRSQTLSHAAAAAAAVLNPSLAAAAVAA